MTEPLVSIICNTYNQEAYIGDALEGFVRQETSFPFEVLVHDDASTDQTPQIIRSYEKKYPNLIKPIYQKENQYSQHISITMNYQLPRARGEFIAFCEGDDYWIDKNKLQKQVDALNNHPDVDICGHRARRQTKDGFTGYTAPRETDDIIPIEELILHGGGQFVATASLMLRTAVMRQRTPMLELMSLDYVWQLQGGLRGGLLYLNDTMSVYRVMANGSWSSRMKGNVGSRNAHSDRVITMLHSFNDYTENKYAKAVDLTIKELEYKQLLREKDYKTMMSKEFRDVFSQKPQKHKLRVFIGMIFGRKQR